MIKVGESIQKNDPRIKNWDNAVEPMDNQYAVRGYDYYSNLIYGVIELPNFEPETVVYITDVEEI